MTATVEAAREPAQTARSPADVEFAPSLLATVPRPAADESVVSLQGVTAGGLEAVQAQWGLEGGAVVLTGRRPFLDVTGRAGFRPDGTLSGDVAVRASLTLLGLRFGEATWSVAGWSPETALATPSVQLQGTTLRVDFAGLPSEAIFTPDPSVAVRTDGTATMVELPADALPEGEPLSPRYAEIFRGLLGADVGDLSIHADAPIAEAPAFVSNADLFFAPGIYGVDSPETLRILDAAVRAALAGIFGPVGQAPPAAAQDTPPPGVGSATAPAAVDPSPASTHAEGAGVGTAVGGAATPVGGAAGATSAPVGAVDAVAGVGEAAGEAANPVANVLMPEAPTEPTPAARARGGAVAAGAGGAARAARDLPTADASVEGARGAVTEPVAETAARAQEALAAELGERPAPSPEIVTLVARIRTAIENNRPESDTELLHTDPTQEARNAGATVTGSVEGQVTEASGAYNSMASPPAGSPTLTPTAAPNPSPTSAPMATPATSAAPDPLPPEGRSLDADVAATDQRIAASGMETPVTAAITDGPIQDARNARGGLGELAQRTPEEIRAEEQVAIDSAQGDMAQLQAQAAAALQAARGGTVGTVVGAEGAMTGHEELTRETVAQRAQTTYATAERQVTDLLTPLSRTALAQWDAGLERCSREFHDSLDRVQHWIDERHSGVLGTIVAVGDYVAGLPDWVREEYTRAERKFGNDIGELLLSISSDVNGVIAAAKAIIDRARSAIDALFSQMEAEFPDWAAQERARFSGMLDGLTTRVNEAQTSFVRDVSARAVTAVNEAHAAVEERRRAAGGLIGQVIAAVELFINDPVRAIINGLLMLVHIPPDQFWALIAQIQQVASDIANDPDNFLHNLGEGLQMGFQQFFDHFGMHLLRSFWQWLFSGLQTPIPMPTSFDPMSLMRFGLQLMGITWPNIREILVRHIGPTAVEVLEAAWNLISVLIERGPQGIVDLIKEQLTPENIVGMILDAAIDYLVETLVVQAAQYLFSLLNPVGAAAQAIRLIYQVCAWIFRNAARIFAFVQAVVGGIANIIAGNLGGFANTVERALGSIMVVAVDFIAGLLGLGGLPGRVADVIVDLQTYVLSIVERVVVFLVTQARALLRRMGIGGDEGEGHDDNELGETVRFSGGNESHRLWIDRSGSSAVAMVASTPGPIGAKIAEWRSMLSGTADPRAATVTLIEAKAAELNNDATALAAAFAAATSDPNDANHPPDDSGVEAKERSLASLLRQAFTDFGQADEPALLRAIAAAMPNAATGWISTYGAALGTLLTDAKYVPLNLSDETPLFPDRTAMLAAGTAAAAQAAADPSLHLRLVPWFRNPVHPPTAAATAEFDEHAKAFGGATRSAGAQVSKAFGEAYVDSLRADATPRVDPVDSWNLVRLERMRWNKTGPPSGVINNGPEPLARTDPALRERATGQIIAFLRTMASTRAVTGYGIARFKWAWNHEQSHTYITRAFRQAPLRNARGGYHEWIPTNMVLDVLEHAIADSGVSESGVQHSVQWINVHHHLRSDTHAVFYRVLRTPEYTAETTAGTRQLGEARVGTHSGSGYNAPTGNSGAGTIGQEDFHDALRTAFPGAASGAPAAFVENIASEVDALLWNGQLGSTGVPSDVWDEPLLVWFRLERGGARETGLTLRVLGRRQQGHFYAIANDFSDTLANLDQA